MTGYVITALALVLLVQAQNIYPQLLLARLLFSLGGSATATMVTAILPMMVSHRSKIVPLTSRRLGSTSHNTSISPPNTDLPSTDMTTTHGQESSLLGSDLPPTKPLPTRLAGLVGLCTGCGALVALGLFLPLPTLFQNHGYSPGPALRHSFYVVAAISLVVAVLCFFGLRNLSEEAKSWPSPGLTERDSGSNPYPFRSKKFAFIDQLFKSFALGYEHPEFFLSYVGGFVARASSVGVTLFIPLYVNAYYKKSGMCDEHIRDPHELRKHCQYAYILAARLTGVSQLAALIFAPIFGYLADRYRQFNLPLLAAAWTGVLGYTSMTLLNTPDPHGAGGALCVLLIVSLLGISQIGAIVCSLGLLGHSILGLTDNPESFVGKRVLDPISSSETLIQGPVNQSSESLYTGIASREISDEVDEESSLLLSGQAPLLASYEHLKGSIAGVYSLAGGIGILLLTKIGGILFDRISPLAPFYLLALINGCLLLVGMICGIMTHRRGA